MEFIFGSLFTVALFILVRFMLNKAELDRFQLQPIRYSQSHIYSIARSAVIDKLYRPEPPMTQSRKLLSKNQIAVFFEDKNAYWIKDNQVYRADVINGEIDNSTIKVVDTMGMDKVELDKMFFIIEKLTEGNKNDGGYPGVKDL